MAVKQVLPTKKNIPEFLILPPEIRKTLQLVHSR